MQKLKRIIRKVTAMIMSALMIATVLPAYVYADGPEVVEKVVIEDGSLTVTADGKDAEAIYDEEEDPSDFENVSVSSKNEGTAWAWVGEVTGDVKASSDLGGYTGVYTDNVGGDVVVSATCGTYEGLYDDESFEEEVLSGEYHNDGAGAAVDGKVNGNVGVMGLLGGLAIGGIYDNVEGQLMTAAVDGVAIAKAGDVSKGLYVMNDVGTAGAYVQDVSGPKTAVFSLNTGGRVSIVTGDVKSDRIGMLIVNDSGRTNIFTDGDVNGGLCGICKFGDSSKYQDVNLIDSYLDSLPEDEAQIHAPYVAEYMWKKANGEGLEESQINIIVTGTIRSGENGVGILTTDDGSDLKLTTWKIEPNSNGNLAEKLLDDESDTRIKNKDLEDNIQYIIKIDPSNPPEATLTATKEDGSPLEKCGPDGETMFDWAKENERVLLKIDVQEGYQITGVYGDDGKSVRLYKDANGNYFIDVPWGGGVLLSVTVSKIVAPPAPEPEPETETEDQIWGEPVIIAASSAAEASIQEQVPVQAASVETVTVTAAEINTQILSALEFDPAADSINLNLGSSPAINSDVINVLCEKSDVAKSCSFSVDGKKYTLIIPAFDTNSELYRQCLALLALEPGGVAGPIRLAQIFAVLGFRIIEG